MSSIHANATGRKCAEADELFSGEIDLGRLIPQKEYSRELGIHPRTCQRHEAQDPNFPRPVYINGRAFLPEAVLRKYRAELIRRGYQTIGKFAGNLPKAEG